MAKRRKLYVGCPVRVIDLRSRELSGSSFWKSRSHKIGIVSFLEPEGYDGSLNTQVQFSNGMSLSYDWVITWTWKSLRA